MLCSHFFAAVFSYVVYPYSLFSTDYSWHSLYSVVFTRVFSEALVPVNEHKPLAEATSVLNRKELILYVLRLILLFIYLNIIAF